MMKVKRNNDFDKSLLAYTGKSRKPFKKINRQWGTMKSLCSFSKDRVFTLFTEWRRVLSLGRVGISRVEQKKSFGWAGDEFWTSRGWVLDEPGTSFGEPQVSQGKSRKAPWQFSSSSTMFGWWRGSEEATPGGDWAKGQRVTSQLLTAPGSAY